MPPLSSPVSAAKGKETGQTVAVKIPDIRECLAGWSGTETGNGAAGPRFPIAEDVEIQAFAVCSLTFFR